MELTGKTESLPLIIQNLDTEKGKQWKTEFLENFGIGMANVIDILDPDAIVLGGQRITVHPVTFFKSV